jgi:hypothetical protein
MPSRHAHRLLLTDALWEQRRGLVLAEVEILCRVPAERIAQELLVTFGAQIEAEVLVRFGQGRLTQAFFLVSEKLTDRFHVVLFEVGFGYLGGVVGGKYFHLHHEATVFTDREFFAAYITRYM